MKNQQYNLCYLILIVAFCVVSYSCKSNNSIISQENKSLENVTPQNDESENKLKATEILEAIKKADLPIEKEIIYTAENDPNKLLGRPNQYIEKISWADKRIKQLSKDNLQGGTIEIFDNIELLENRKKYVEAIGKSAPMFTQYQFSHKNALLRIDKDLTPQQANEYEKVLNGL